MVRRLADFSDWDSDVDIPSSPVRTRDVPMVNEVSPRPYSNPVVRATQRTHPKSKLQCPVCDIMYTSVRYPVILSCGHSLCTRCAAKPDFRVCYKSGKRVKTNANGSAKVKKNNDLLDMIPIMKQQKELIEKQKETVDKLKQKDRNQMKDLERLREREKKEGEEYMTCPKCDKKDARDRMLICRTCVQTPLEEMNELMIRYNHILCTYCSHQQMHVGHSMDKFVSFEFRAMLATTVTDTQATVTDAEERRAEEMRRGQESVELWKEAIDSCRDLVEADTHRSGILFIEALKKEASRVEQASEDCGPTLRYARIVKSSINRIQQWKEDFEAKRELKQYADEDA